MTTNAYHVQNAQENEKLVTLLVKVLKEEKLPKESFLYCLILQQLMCLD